MSRSAAVGLSVADIEMGFHDHHVELYRFFVRRTGNATASEDLVQDTFVRALAYRASYRGTGSLRAWLYRIARNLLVDSDSRQGPAVQSLEMSLGSDDPGPWQGILRTDCVDRVRRALDQLQDSHREVLVLARMQELSYREVASVIGTTEGNVKVRVFRALRALKQQLEKDGHDDV